MNFIIIKDKRNIYLIIYYNILNIIKFLLDYQLFTLNLFYISVRLFNKDNARVYNKIYTED